MCRGKEREMCLFWAVSRSGIDGTQDAVRIILIGHGGAEQEVSLVLGEVCKLVGQRFGEFRGRGLDLHAYPARAEH